MARYKKSQCRPVTQKEQAWIDDLQKLANRMPKNLWLYAAAGEACIMKTPPDGEQMGAGSGGYGVNPDNLITTITGFRCDGGDW